MQEEIQRNRNVSHDGYSGNTVSSAAASAAVKDDAVHVEVDESGNDQKQKDEFPSSYTPTSPRETTEEHATDSRQQPQRTYNGEGDPPWMPSQLQRQQAADVRRVGSKRELD